jgi:hypothetical protein
MSPRVLARQHGFASIETSDHLARFTPISSTSSRSDRRPRRGSHGVLIALTVLGPLSCGSTDGGKPVYPVHGQLFYKGKPTPGALVLFHTVDDPDPRAPRPHGRVDQDGHFTLTTHRANDGAPVGHYAVTVDWRKELPGRGGVGPSLVPLRYGKPWESPLRVTIEAGTNNLPRLDIP